MTRLPAFTSRKLVMKAMSGRYRICVRCGSACVLHEGSNDFRQPLAIGAISCLHAVSEILERRRSTYQSSGVGFSKKTKPRPLLELSFVPQGFPTISECLK